MLHTAAAPRSAAAQLRIGGFVPFSTVDHPGRMAAVVFVQGCPWRCPYCHNPHLQASSRPSTGLQATDAPDWAALDRWLASRVGLIDSVVFSGGEPTTDPALPAAVDRVRELGFAVGLHTAGLAPLPLQRLLDRLDWVGLDVKAPLGDPQAWARVTGLVPARPGTAEPVRRSLQLLLDSGVAFECRTTVHPALLDERDLLRLGNELAAAGVQHWALQLFRATGCASGLQAVGAGYPAAGTLALLRGCVPGFSLRLH